MCPSVQVAITENFQTRSASVAVDGKLYPTSISAVRSAIGDQDRIFGRSIIRKRNGPSVGAASSTAIRYQS